MKSRPARPQAASKRIAGIVERIRIGPGQALAQRAQIAPVLARRRRQIEVQRGAARGRGHHAQHVRRHVEASENEHARRQAARRRCSLRRRGRSRKRSIACARCARPCVARRQSSACQSSRLAPRSQASSQSRRQAWYFANTSASAFASDHALSSAFVPAEIAFEYRRDRRMRARRAILQRRVEAPHQSRRIDRARIVRVGRRSPSSISPTNSPGARKRRFAAMPCVSASVFCSQRRIVGCGIRIVSGSNRPTPGGNVAELAREQLGEDVERIPIVEAEIGVRGHLRMMPDCASRRMRRDMKMAAAAALLSDAESDYAAS